MAEVRKTEVKLFQFSGGLNTEANAVNIPPTDSPDLLNILIREDQAIRPRFAMDFIAAKSSDNLTYETHPDNFTEFGDFNDPVLNSFSANITDSGGTSRKFLFVLIGRYLYIYLVDSLVSISNIDDPYQTLDLSSYFNPEGYYIKTTFIEDRNRVILINPHLDLGLIKLNESNVFEFVSINPAERDIEDSEFISTYTFYPLVRTPNSKMYVAVKALDKSDTQLLEDATPGVGPLWEEYFDLYGPPLALPVDFSGSSLIDFSQFNNYSDVRYNIFTNIVPLPNKGYTAGAFFAGRLFLSGNSDNPNTIYFSQIVEKDKHYGKFHSITDPLNAADPEPQADDGGTIIVSGAGIIYSMAAFRNGIIIFANNGIWYVAGASGGAFKPNDFIIEKISSVEIINPHAYALVEDSVVFASIGGIYAIVLDTVSSNVSIQNLSDPKIKSFFRNIPTYNKRGLQIKYNNSTKRLYFLVNTDIFAWQESRLGIEQPTGYYTILIYDLKFKAWFIYKIEQNDVGTRPLLGSILSITAPLSADTVVTNNNGVVVTNELLESITSFASQSGVVDTLDIILIYKKSGTTIKWGLGLLESESNKDFEISSDSEDDPSTFRAFYLSAQLNFATLVRNKHTPYGFFIFERTESFQYDENDEDITASSCLLTTIFDWAKSGNSKYGTPIEIYRANKYNISRYDGTNPDVDVVTVRERIRGRGNSVQYKLEKNGDKIFIFYGVELTVEASQRY